MPIENLSGILRMPRIGKIRLGELKSSDKGNPYPKALDYFRVEEDGGITSKEAVEAFRRVYGDKPKLLEIMFPTEDAEKFFPQFYTAYAKSKGKICQGDGKTARRRVRKGENLRLEDIPCLGESCDWYASNKCRRLATLQVILPKVPGLGVWHISTTSRNSIINVNSGIALVRQITGGRISFIPLKLRLKEMEVTGPDGFLKKIYALDLANEDICFADIMQAMNAPPIKALLPDPQDDPRPVDLYPDSVVDDEVDDEPDSGAAKTETPSDTDNPNGDAPGGSKKQRYDKSGPAGEPVPYQKMVTVASKPKDTGKMLSAVCKDENGNVIMLCKNIEGPLKGSFLSLEPGSSLQVTGQLKENGHRYVMVEGLDVIPF